MNYIIATIALTATLVLSVAGISYEVLYISQKLSPCSIGAVDIGSSKDTTFTGNTSECHGL